MSQQLHTLIIGVDESGKGDFFGPLVIAGCCFSDDESAKMAERGIRDSKLVSDSRARELCDYITELIPTKIVTIMPEVYNARYKEIKNLNKLLADGHAEVIAALTKETGAKQAISDKFGKPELIEDALESRGVAIKLKQVVRGESFSQVAAASIVARATFLDRLDELSQKFDVHLQKGAGSPTDEAGRTFLRKHGTSELGSVAKLHFKNTEKIGASGVLIKK